MLIPNLEDFEKTLFEIANEAELLVNKLYNEAKERGEVLEDGNMRHEFSIGSTLIYLDKRKPLYKFLTSLIDDPNKFYSIFIFDRKASISLRNIRTWQSYILNDAAYDLVAKRLKEAYGWEVFNNVRVD